MKRGFWLYILTIILFFFVLIILSCGQSRQAEEQSMDEFLVTVDQAIDDGNLDFACNLLSGTIPVPQNSYEWLRILKRCYSVSEKKSDYALLAELAGRAAADIPGQKDFQYLQSYGLLYSGNPVAAWDAANNLGNQYDPIRQIILLNYHPVDFVENKISAANLYWADEYQVSAFVSEFQRTGDYRLALNALLLYAQEGHWDGSRWLFEALLPVLPEQVMELAISAGYYDIAQKALDDLHRQGVVNRIYYRYFHIELLIQLNYQDEARRELISFISDFPDHSWEPYMNLYQLTKNPEYLYRAIEIWPSEVNLLKEGVLELPEKHYFLSLLRNEAPESFAALYLAFRFDEDLNTDRFITSLWEIHQDWKNGNDESLSLYSFLSWYFIGVRDFEAYEVLINQNPRFSEALVSLFYQGQAAFIQKDYDTALDFFSECLQKNESWELYLAQGFGLYYSHRFQDSVQAFRRSLMLYQSIDPIKHRAEIEGDIQIHIAWALNSAGEQEASERMVLLGLKNSPANQKGLFLYKALSRKD